MFFRRMMCLLTLCLTAGWVGATEQLRLFQGAATNNWGHFSQSLENEGVKIDDGIPVAVLATIAAQTAKERQLLGESTVEEAARQFLEQNQLEVGSVVPVAEFRRRGAPTGEGYHLSLVANVAPAQTAPVATASAPTTPPAAPAPQPAAPVAAAAPALSEADQAALSAAERNAATARAVVTDHGRALATLNGRLEAAERQSAAAARAAAVVNTIGTQLEELRAEVTRRVADQDVAIAELRQEQGDALMAAENVRRETQEAIAGMPGVAASAAEAAVGAQLRPLQQGILATAGALLLLALAFTGWIWRNRRQQAAINRRLAAEQAAQKRTLSHHAGRITAVEKEVLPIVLPDDLDQQVDALTAEQPTYQFELLDRRDGKRYSAAVGWTTRPGYFTLKGVKDQGKNLVHRSNLRQVLYDAGKVQPKTGKHRFLDEVAAEVELSSPWPDTQAEDRPSLAVVKARFPNAA